jgi:hypothetical protein
MMMPLVQKRFWFLVREKACSTKKTFWSSDPHQAILHILQTSYLAFTFDPTYFLTSYLDLAFYQEYLSLEIHRG